jgi:predicted dinucleotide-binding enzyme
LWRVLNGSHVLVLKGEVDGMQLDGFLAGDDAEAKKQVAAFLEQIGFRPIDVGPLAMACYLAAWPSSTSRSTPATGGLGGSGWKLVEPTG